MTVGAALVLGSATAGSAAAVELAAAGAMRIRGVLVETLVPQGLAISKRVVVDRGTIKRVAVGPVEKV